ncbi:tRNA1(Val) (adenine(37)-N6)-methyltransferase [Deminuibacter soli]|uniref:tRNA1(Val) (adenine(37)-N6)-methyltransferase n=1 Tax=Deminuibacter soli TaxID=2291815 RepID=A0A3E1NKU6_9BACT|nr:methyltransferase [Deminuibacter soli]RFM28553.1 methyltransferase domain-containing protein [Deminuibacter soli]
MPNSYFRFKQFTVHQDKCAMKVCTDACLFGALSPLVLPGGAAVTRVLDIGTGTGLLSLQYAQLNADAHIDAVEIDDGAFEQAGENFAASPWPQRLQVFHTPLQQYKAAQAYELIISNPPFFENDLKSQDNKRNLALHSEALRIEALLQHAHQLLTANGLLWLLLPWHRSAETITAATTQGFYLHRETAVQQTTKHGNFRSMLLLGKTAQPVITDTLVIKDAANQYTPAFVAALQAFYLYL